MSKKILFSFLSFLLYFFILSGCSGDEQSDKAGKQSDKITENPNDKKNETSEKSKSNNAKEEYDEDELVEAIESAPTYKEINFQNIDWWFGTPDREPNGGIWVYTKENHPAKFEDTVDWEKNDMLLVQTNDSNYINHEMEIKALQIIDEDVIKIVVNLNKDEDATEKFVPRRYASVDKGQLEGKKFILETAIGEKVNVGLDIKTTELTKGE